MANPIDDLLLSYENLIERLPVVTPQEINNLIIRAEPYAANEIVQTRNQLLRLFLIYQMRAIGNSSPEKIVRTLNEVANFADGCGFNNLRRRLFNTELTQEMLDLCRGS